MLPFHGEMIALKMQASKKKIDKCIFSLVNLCMRRFQWHVPDPRMYR